MKKYRDFWFPDGDVETPPAVYNEWAQKGQAICDMADSKKTVVQAGGNSGLFPIYLSEHFENVITFEPITETYDTFVQNLEDRPHIENVTLHKLGLGAQEGNAEKVTISPRNWGANQIKESKDGDIQVIALDSLELQDVNLLWLDIEGSEVDALKGAVETIRRCKPVIVLENKGLIPGFGGDLLGAPLVVEWMNDTLNYVKIKRMMRDDIFVPIV
jgi:FkbM family methyltransferase